MKNEGWNFATRFFDFFLSFAAVKALVLFFFHSFIHGVHFDKNLISESSCVSTKEGTWILYFERMLYSHTVPISQSFLTRKMPAECMEWVMLFKEILFEALPVSPSSRRLTFSSIQRFF